MDQHKRDGIYTNLQHLVLAKYLQGFREPRFVLVLVLVRVDDSDIITI